MENGGKISKFQEKAKKIFEKYCGEDNEYNALVLCRLNQDEVDSECKDIQASIRVDTLSRLMEVVGDYKVPAVSASWDDIKNLLYSSGYLGMYEYMQGMCSSFHLEEDDYLIDEGEYWCILVKNKEGDYVIEIFIPGEETEGSYDETMSLDEFIETGFFESMK